MPKGIANKKYTGEFKQEVVEYMREHLLGYSETAEKFGIRHKRVQDWERIYLIEGVEGLYVERRGRTSVATGIKKGRPFKLSQQVEKDLIAENQRLRMENEYLKKLNALVSERVQREKKLK